jgi:hypothetical protein
MQQCKIQAKKPISLAWKEDTLINSTEQSVANTALQTLPLKKTKEECNYERQ